MAENVIYTQADPSTIEAVVYDLVRQARTSRRAAQLMMVRCGLVALGRIRKAFVAKARGGVDEAGDRWQPLSRRTIAYSVTRGRGRGGRTRAEKKRDARPSQALNSRQQERWWMLYRQGLAQFKGNKASAAKRAWAILKREGATTLLAKYGGRSVEILRDTGLLLNSLSPGVASADQIFRLAPGTVIIGTNRKGALFHHMGIPGRLPQRRLWPDPKRWPKSWRLDILEQLRQGMIDIMKEML